MLVQPLLLPSCRKGLLFYIYIFIFFLSHLSDDEKGLQYSTSDRSSPALWDRKRKQPVEWCNWKKQSLVLDVPRAGTHGGWTVRTWKGLWSVHTRTLRTMQVWWRVQKCVFTAVTDVLLMLMRNKHINFSPGAQNERRSLEYHTLKTCVCLSAHITR